MPDITSVSSSILIAFSKALDSIPIVGTVSQILQAIGLNVKGKTQHISAAQAYQVADVVAYQNFAAQLQAGGSALINAVGQEYPAWLASLIRSGTLWGGTKSIQAIEILGYLERDYPTSSDMFFRAKASAYNHVVWIARNVDADGFQDNFTAQYKAQMQNFFIFLKSKYESLNIDEKGNVPASQGFTLAGGYFVPALAALAIAAAFFLKKKKK